MREDLLNGLMSEYEAQRKQNEREEKERREQIRRNFPEIEQKVSEREELIFGTIHQILDGKAKAEDLTIRMGELNDAIGKMLRKEGFPEDYLAPVYRCSKCKDTGYTGEPVREPCECLRKAYQEKVREKIGLGMKQKQTFESFDAEFIPNETVGNSGLTQRDFSLHARNECENWANLYPNVRKHDILLSGGSGLGKTFLMNAMAERLIERGISVLTVSAYSFLQTARKSYFDAENGVQEFMEVPVLMLDDLGSEPLMQNVTVEQLFHLINERQARGLSTVISTNLPIPNLKDRYTERVASRLTDKNNCIVLTLQGQDLRKVERK